MQRKSTVKRNLIYQMIYRIATIITPLITSPYISRILGAENLGVFSATYAHANYFILVAMLGVEYYGSRSIAICDSKIEIKNKFWEIYYVQLMACIIAIFLYTITLIGTSPERKVYSIAQGIWIIAAGLDINWFFFGTQQFRLTVTRNIIIKIISIICIFIFVQNENQLLRYILIMAGAMLINQVVMWFFLLKEIGFQKPVLSKVKPNIYPMLKLFIPVMGLSIFQIMDKTMVDLLSDEINSGCYYNTDRLMNIPLGLITAMSTVMLPKLSEEFHGNSQINAERLLKQSSELTMSLAPAIAFGLGVISYEFVPLFFGNEFTLCILLILGCIPVIIVKSLEEYIRSQYLIPTEKDNVYIKAVFLAALINGISNYFLISFYGAFGAIIGTLIAETTLLIVQMMYVRKQINFLKIFIKNSYYIALGFLMFVIIRMFASNTEFNNLTTVIISIILGVMIYGLGIIVYGKINTKSIYHFAQINIKRK